MVSTDRWLWIFRAGVGFLLLAALLFLLGFSTDHWHDDDVEHYGLWRSCKETGCSTIDFIELPAYRVATQAFQIMATAFFALSPLVHLIFYCSKKRKDTGWRSRIFDVGYSAGTVFHLCSLLIFGLQNSTPENFSWSFRMSCASSAIAFIGIILVIVSRKKALYKFTFRAVNRSKRKTAAAPSPRDGGFTAPSSQSDSTSSRGGFIRRPEQTSSSSQIPTNVNITVNINPPPHNTGAFPPVPSEHLSGFASHQPPSSSSPFASHQPPSSSSPFINHSLHHPSRHEDPPHTESAADPYYSSDRVLTQVRPAPKSSIAHYSSPMHRKQFGPSDRNRPFEPTDNYNDSNVSYSTGGNIDIPVISVSAPPYDDVHAQHDESIISTPSTSAPPSGDIVEKNNSTSGKNLTHREAPSAPPSYDDAHEENIVMPPSYSEAVSTSATN